MKADPTSAADAPRLVNSEQTLTQPTIETEAGPTLSPEDEFEPLLRALDERIAVEIGSSLPLSAEARLQAFCASIDRGLAEIAAGGGIPLEVAMDQLRARYLAMVDESE